MSQTYLSAIVILLTTLLPKFGITIGSDELTTTIQTIIVLVSGLWILVRRYQAGGINAFGGRK